MSYTAAVITVSDLGGRGHLPGPEHLYGEEAASDRSDLVAGSGAVGCRADPDGT